ncbi:hypothetical protein [Pannonibacter phragmitetus]|uniref:hypothetical protein n=1 Tax=Pannonibacter phragmitetus TaxID=121719 RepID=UPI000374D5B5|nr:hypothetical protein [Pannonibacter phragmitetus]
MKGEKETADALPFIARPACQPGQHDVPRRNVRIITGTLRFLGHDLVFVSIRPHPASAKFAWSERRRLTHNGSSSMNLAKNLIDTEKNLAVAVTTNFPRPKADMAATSALENLYKKYA